MEVNMDRDIEEEINMPTRDNLGDIINDLMVNDAYTRRQVAESILRPVSGKSSSGFQQLINPLSKLQEGNIGNRNPNHNSSPDNISDRDHLKLQTWRCLYLDKLQKIFVETEDSYKKALKNVD